MQYLIALTMLVASATAAVAPLYLPEAPAPYVADLADPLAVHFVDEVQEQELSPEQEDALLNMYSVNFVDGHEVPEFQPYINTPLISPVIIIAAFKAAEEAVEAEVPQDLKVRFVDSPLEDSEALIEVSPLEETPVDAAVEASEDLKVHFVDAAPVEEIAAEAVKVVDSPVEAAEDLKVRFVDSAPVEEIAAEAVEVVDTPVEAAEDLKVRFVDAAPVEEIAAETIQVVDTPVKAAEDLKVRFVDAAPVEEIAAEAVKVVDAPVEAAEDLKVRFVDVAPAQAVPTPVQIEDIPAPGRPGKVYPNVMWR